MKRFIYHILTVVLALLMTIHSGYSQNLDAIFNKIHYRNVGPSKQGGRVMDFGIPDQKKQPYTYYVAFSSGGLWKTTDNFLTFKPITDNEEIISIGDVAVSHSNPEIVWIGTGNASYYGSGMYKSGDGGKTWQKMGLADSYYITRIRIHPTNPDIVYLAATGYNYSNDKERGIFKTTNGGRSWKKSLDVRDEKDYIGAADLVMHPANPDILYASAWDRKRRGNQCCL